MRQAVLGGSAVTGDYTYDKDSGPANIRFNASGALQYESTYQWAADGNLRSQSSTNGTHGGGTVIASYFHDSLDRIMNAFYDGAASKSEAWRYDLNGNIFSSHHCYEGANARAGYPHHRALFYESRRAGGRPCVGS